MIMAGLLAEAVSSGGEQRDDFGKIAALLRRIDDLPPGANGALVFEDAAKGVVLVEAGRVCWAASASRRTRLTDRLRQATRLSASEWESMFRRCVEAGTPFGQTMVRLGILRAADLRAALLEHTSEALARLAAGEHEPRWVEVPGRRYDAEFTFSPAELLAHASDAQWGPLADLARRNLRELLANGGCGCAFVSGPGGIVPIGVEGVEELGAGGVLDLAEWGVRFLDASRAAAGFAGLASLLRDDGPSAAVWSSGGIHYAALCAERSDLVNILAHLRRERDGH